MKKRLSLALAVVLALGLLAGCGQNAGGSGGGDASGGTPIRVVLDWTPNTNHTGLYAALENGYFAEEGLDVSIQQPPESGAEVLLAAGNCEFAVSIQEGMGPAIARDEPLGIVAIAAVINHNTSGIMSMKSAGIETPGDLAGKRFATWETPLVDAIIKNIVEGDGGSFDDVMMVPNAATDSIAAVQTDVDAAWIYYAWDGVAAELQGLDISYLDLGQINPTFDYYTPVIATNTEYAAANGDTVKKFMRAVTKGYEYAIAEPEAAAQMLLKHAPELDEALVVASQKYLADKYQGDAARWGEIDAERWGNFYSWMYQQGLLDNDIGQQGFTNEYLP